MGRGSGSGQSGNGPALRGRGSVQAAKPRQAPNKTARLIAGQMWPDVQAQYQLGKGVYGFSCAGHGGVVAVIGQAELDPAHVEVARKRGLTELVAEVHNGQGLKRYTTARYTEASLRELAERDPDHVAITEVWVGEEDCDWATIIHANPKLLDGGKQAGYFGESADWGHVQHSMERWNERFLADLDPDYVPLPGGQIETEDRHEALLASGAAIRTSAIGQEDGHVRVWFRDKDGKEMTYLMSQETYRAIPYGTDATPDDYRKHGEVFREA